MQVLTKNPIFEIYIICKHISNENAKDTQLSVRNDQHYKQNVSSVSYRKTMSSIIKIYYKPEMFTAMNFNILFTILIYLFTN